MSSWGGPSRLGTADHFPGHVIDARSRSRIRSAASLATVIIPPRPLPHTVFPVQDRAIHLDQDQDRGRSVRRSPEAEGIARQRPTSVPASRSAGFFREPLERRPNRTRKRHRHQRHRRHPSSTRTAIRDNDDEDKDYGYQAHDEYDGGDESDDESDDEYEGEDGYLMAMNMAALSSMDLGMASGGRSGASTPNSVASAQLNGVGAGVGVGGPVPGPNYMTSLPAGHQQDLNYLYDKIQELSKLLASNREKVRELSKKAEEAGRRTALSNGSHPTDGDGSVKTDCEYVPLPLTQATNARGAAQRILELERELRTKDHLLEVYKHEQRENTNLIGMYEDAVGTMTEQIRNYCLGIEARFLEQKRHYNNLLQQEKDDHFKSRLERDEYFAQTLKYIGQLRHANRLRTDEWCDEFRVVAALQTQVRCLRRVAGWDAEKPEEEAGWEYLRDCPLNDTGTGEGV